MTRDDGRRHPTIPRQDEGCCLREKWTDEIDIATTCYQGCASVCKGVDDNIMISLVMKGRSSPSDQSLSI